MYVDAPRGKCIQILAKGFNQRKAADAVSRGAFPLFSSRKRTFMKKWEENYSVWFKNVKQFRRVW